MLAVKTANKTIGRALSAERRRLEKCLSTGERKSQNRRSGTADNGSAQSLDFFAQPLPKADVVTMCMNVHDWNLEKKKGESHR